MNKALSLISLFAALALAACQPSGEQPPLAGAAIGGPFTLTSEDGTRFDSAKLDGKYRMIYFGYTFCPDICPTDMQNLMKGYDAFAKKDAGRAARVVPLFITIDPKRDTPDVLKQWTDAFDPRLIGLTGSETEIDAVAKKFVVFFKRETPGKDGAYLVDHARMALLMGPKGEPVALLSQDKDAQTIAGELDRWVR